MIRSPPTQGAWIEILQPMESRKQLQSPPTQGAWIEIAECELSRLQPVFVAPYTGGVD